MAQLYFHYSAMNAGKSTSLLQSAHNYREQGMEVAIHTAAIDDRYRRGVVRSRIGLEAAASMFDADTDLFAATLERLAAPPNRTARTVPARSPTRSLVSSMTGPLVSPLARRPDCPLACILVDEAQFLTAVQVDQLALVVDELDLPVLCYGLRTDFQGALFPGSARLLAIADKLVELKAVCTCGRKATMTVRLDVAGRVVAAGEQVEIGGNERYESKCRRHYRELMQAAGLAD